MYLIKQLYFPLPKANFASRRLRNILLSGLYSIIFPARKDFGTYKPIFTSPFLSFKSNPFFSLMQTISLLVLCPYE